MNSIKLSGLALVASLGCGPQGTLDDDAESATTQSSSASSSPASSQGLGASSGEAADSGQAGYEEDDGADGCTFTCPDNPNPPPPSGGFSGGECSLGDQDCPPGEKCTPWANDGGPVWNATRCVQIVEHPDPRDAPCTAGGSATSGDDSCAMGLMCFNVDPNTLLGVCRQICGAVPGDPACPEPTWCATFGENPICLAPCDPLARSCADDEGCFPAGAVRPHGVGPLPPFFACQRNQSVVQQVAGGACSLLHSVCPPPGVCLEFSRVPGCETEACCTTVCPLGQDPCVGDAVCVPYWDPAPNASLDGVGICGWPG